MTSNRDSHDKNQSETDECEHGYQPPRPMAPGLVIGDGLTAGDNE